MVHDTSCPKSQTRRPWFSRETLPSWRLFQACPRIFEPVLWRIPQPQHRCSKEKPCPTLLELCSRVSAEIPCACRCRSQRGRKSEGLDKAFLSNSGAEAVECAIKLARKFSGKPEIIAMMGAFHGKTMGALSATWDKKYREPFQPLVPEFKHVPPDNLEKVREAITDKTAAVLLEPIRGEGGVRIPPDGFLSGVREICDEKNVLLILDEVQTSFGRTGKLFGCEHWGVTPDVMCLAKPFAGGLPIGITVAKEHIMSSLKVGEHSSTFSGSPLVCAAACAAINVLVEEKLAERAATLGRYFKAKLEELQAKHKIVKEVRGLGLMLGVELRYDVLNIILNAMDKGVLILDAGRNVLRFLPPLVIEKEQIDKTISVLDTVIGEEENARTSGTSTN